MIADSKQTEANSSKTKHELNREEARLLYVERKLIDEWILKNSPQGINRLALRAEVSTATIAWTRLGRVPVRQATREKLALAVGVQVSALFPSKT